MKALVIGLGSMGKRRIRNLQALGVQEMYGYDQHVPTAEEAQKQSGIQLLGSLENISEYAFDLGVISTPPGAHFEFAKICIENKIPFFMELNLITEESEKIRELAGKNQVLVLPSDTEIFDADITELGAAIGENFEGYFLFQLGQNINDWHPWQKPGEHFIFKPETNGIREMLRIELPWMLRMFGKVAKISANSARFKTEEYGVDDYMSIELEFAGGVRGVLVLDLLSSEVIKRMDVVSSDKRIIWHERENKIEVQSRGASSIAKDLRDKHMLEQYKFHEDAHLAEMQHVLDVVAGKEASRLTFEQELEVLHLIDEIERICRNNI